MSNLFICPSHDDVTAYLWHYCKELVEESEQRGFDTLFKDKKNACFKIVIPIIQHKHPSFIMFNGHGSPDLICGHNDEILIKYGQNHELLNRKLVYSLSCSSASVLGSLIGNDQTTFIGYTQEFAVGMDTNSQASIRRDNRAKLFLEPSNLLVKSLLKGNSAQKSIEKAKSLMRQNLSKLRTDTSPDAKDYVPFLFNNYLALSLFGDAQRKIKK